MHLMIFKIHVFREEWKNSFPWVTVDPSGNPGLAYCTVCCKSLTAKKYILRYDFL